MKNLNQSEEKIYYILGSIYGCLTSCYFMLQFAFNGVEGITRNIGFFSSISIVFSFVMAAVYMVKYIKKLLA